MNEEEICLAALLVIDLCDVVLSKNTGQDVTVVSYAEARR
jgi:hypothetical protein